VGMLQAPLSLLVLAMVVSQAVNTPSSTRP
jgi:hypothetical protein